MPWSLSAHVLPSNATDRARLAGGGAFSRARVFARGRCPIPASVRSARTGIVEDVTQTITGGVSALDDERRYHAAVSKDPRFDGVFFIAVTSTGIYCRPSCPAITPKRENMRFLPQRGGGPGGRLPGLQTVPPGRLPRLARVEHQGRRGGPRDAADRRRRGRPGRRWRALPAGSATSSVRCAAWSPPNWARARLPSPAHSVRRQRASWSRRPRCPCPRSPSQPGSPASGSSTRPSARSSR